MRLDQLISELDLCLNADDIVLVEINGVQHEVHDVLDTSQGVVLIVDTDREEREMR